MKRFFDIVLAGTGLLISLPLWLFFSLLVKLHDRGTVFYSQQRVGRSGKIFNVFKFRSMVEDAEQHTGAVWASENDPRVTRVGRMLRATAMDELPQLWNILKGDMSFVGPRAERPELTHQFSRTIPRYSERFSVRPGLTGLAQVYGQYDTPAARKLRYDLLYAKNSSLVLDVKLIVLSFLITFTGKWEQRGRKTMKCRLSGLRS